MYYPLTTDPAKNVALMNRFQRENIGAAQEALGARRRPQPPRNLIATVLTGAIVLTWIGPQNLAGILGYNVYLINQSRPVQNINAPQFPSASAQGSNVSATIAPTIQASIQNLTSLTAYAFWVSSYTALLESLKVQIIATPA